MMHAVVLLAAMQLFRVHINGSSATYSFLIDTGSSYNFVDTRVAQRLGLKSRDAGTVHGAGANAVAVKAADGVTFGIGDVRTTFDDVRITDLSGLGVDG